MNAEETLKKLINEPLYLLKVICYNNPLAVSSNFSMLGIDSEGHSEEEVLKYVLELSGKIKAKELYALLNVPFNPDAKNDTATYLPVLEIQKALLLDSGKPQNEALYWGELFEETIFKIQETNKDFTESITDKEEKKKPCCNACKRKEERKQLALILGGGTMLLILIIALSKV